MIGVLNERFRHCISMTRMLNQEDVLSGCGVEPADSDAIANQILYQHAIEQCQAAALDELFGNPGECFQVMKIMRVCTLIPIVLDIC